MNWWDIEFPLWQATIFVVAIIIVVSSILFGRLHDKDQKEASKRRSKKR